VERPGNPQDTAHNVLDSLQRQSRLGVRLDNDADVARH
jgi:hypothetical protein